MSFKLNYNTVLGYFISRDIEEIRIAGRKYFSDIDELYNSLKKNIYMEHEIPYKNTPITEVIGEFQLMSDFKEKFAEYLI